MFWCCSDNVWQHGRAAETCSIGRQQIWYCFATGTSCSVWKLRRCRFQRHKFLLLCVQNSLNQQPVNFSLADCSETATGFYIFDRETLVIQVFSFSQVLCTLFQSVPCCVLKIWISIHFSFSLLDTLLLIHQTDDHVSISISIGNTAGVLAWFWINTKFYWALSLHLAHTDIKDTDTAHWASYREQLTVFP